MVNAATETCDGRIETRFHITRFEDEDFSYEDLTELLILMIKKKPKRSVVKLPLRKSLFPHVQPYVYFQLYDGEKLSFPKQIAKNLTWEIGPRTPWIVKQTVEKSGYRLVVSGREDWCGTWSETRYAVCYKILKSYQKINHFPGTYEIGHKDRLWKNVNRLIAVFGRKQFAFVPRTFILPEEFPLLREAWEGKKWILKPPASSRGRGVSVVSRWSQLLKKRSACTLVQRYVSRPMLINGSKFDLRVYALVTDFDPLKIYLYSEGLVRFACGRYDVAETSLDDKFVHLTNYSVNKSSPRYKSNDTTDKPKGHKWPLKCLWRYLAEEERVNIDVLKSKIRDIVLKAFISAEASVACFSRVHLTAKHNCFELFGLDILIDEDLKPWLLEVNISPSLNVPSPLDLGVKGRLIRDVFNLVGYRIPPTLMTLDSRSNQRPLNAREKQKQAKFMYQKDSGDFDQESILDCLTPDDLRVLIQYEDELANLGDFQRIFPTLQTRKYFRYFEAPRYYNLLLSAWEIANGHDRSKGIAKLRELCKTKHHLR